MPAMSDPETVCCPATRVSAGAGRVHAWRQCARIDTVSETGDRRYALRTVLGGLLVSSSEIDREVSVRSWLHAAIGAQ